MNTQALGAHAEAAALAYLQQRGMRCVQQNYRCRWGEIDLIMQDADTTVFVEVRLRSRADFGGALASIDRRKQHRLVRTAQHFLQRCASADANARIDVVHCARDRGGALRLDWIANAVELGG